jgi:hypothetical protein
MPAAQDLPSLAELGGCIFAKPNLTRQGYASTIWKGKHAARHRIAWIEAYGPIPEDMVVDHICHNVAIANGMCLSSKSICIHRSCINLKHLRLLTRAENQNAGLNGFGSRTHCKNGGHELTEDNIGRGAKQNYCKACQKENTRKAMITFRAKKKAAK